jgi:hypothetical protein
MLSVDPQFISKRAADGHSPDSGLIEVEIVALVAFWQCRVVVARRSVPCVKSELGGITRSHSRRREQKLKIFETSGNASNIWGKRAF